MARQIHRLTVNAVKRLDRNGLHPDGGGLYLQVTRNGAKSWIFRFSLAGRQRYMGLGSERLVSLADARAMAIDYKRSVAAGHDPILVKRAQRPKPPPPRPPTFKLAAETYIAAAATTWRNAKHIAQWSSTLETYAYPAIGKLTVDEIDTAAILSVLEPIWRLKPETASRIRGRLQSVLDWASAMGHRSGDNPARWEGHLDKLLPRQSRHKRVKHHPALPYAEIPQFMAGLRSRQGPASLALQFLILTAARTGEAVGARWSEIDLARATWTVPAKRMKTHVEHRVPLSEGAIKVLSACPKGKGDAPVFPGSKPGSALSNMALRMMLRRMDRTDLTVHGFRSTFRDWAAEETDFSGEVAEMALAHAVANKVEAAYRRGDLFDKRRALLDVWDRQCRGLPTQLEAGRPGTPAMDSAA